MKNSKFMLHRLLSLVMAMTMVMSLFTTGAAAADVSGDDHDHDHDALADPYGINQMLADEDAWIEEPEEELGLLEGAVAAVRGFFDMSDLGIEAEASGRIECPKCGKIENSHLITCLGCNRQYYGCVDSHFVQCTYCKETYFKCRNTHTCLRYNCTECGAKVASAYSHRATCNLCGEYKWSCKTSHTCPTYTAKCSKCGRGAASATAHRSTCATCGGEKWSCQTHSCSYRYTCSKCGRGTSTANAHRTTCSSCKGEKYTCSTHTCVITKTEYVTVDKVSCVWCGSKTAHSGVCPSYSTWLASTCSYCRSTSHKMKDCPEYKKSGAAILDTCDSCGVTVSATINGADWTFPHNPDCKEIKTNVTTSTNYVNNGKDGVYINGVLVPGSNFNAVNTYKPPALTTDPSKYNDRVNSTYSGEAKVLTYPRTLSQLTSLSGSNYYDDQFWKDIMRARGNKGYTTDGSGIWDYQSNKYRIAKVPQGGSDCYVLVKLPSDWLSRLNETNPNPAGSVHPTGTTTTRTETVTSTTTTTSQSNNGSKVHNFPSGGSQNAKPSSTYSSQTASVIKGGGDINGHGQVIKQPSNGWKIVTKKDGKTAATDSKGNYIYEKTDTSTEEVEVEVHVCSYATYYTDTCGGNHETNTQHTATTVSCCGSSSSSQQSHTYSKRTATDMGTDIHRVESFCSSCGHIGVSYAPHGSGENCPDCNRPLGKYIKWHWYNSAEGPVITEIYQRYYTTLKFPSPTRGRMDYVFTGWWTEWGGQGMEMREEDQTMYVHVMPTDFYASWDFIIRQDFSAPTISTTFYTSEAEAKKSNGNAIQDMNLPVQELWVRIDAIDLEGNLVENHKQYIGQGSTADQKGTAHCKWHEDNPLWTSGLVPDVENWRGSLQLAGEGNTWHETPYIVKVTRNEPLTVIARDAWANTRSHTINITNFDEGTPIIEGFMQSNDSWTNQPVRVSVMAHDDQGLAQTAYKWDYTLNSENNEVVHPGVWTATPYLDMPDAGRVRVTVKDAVGKETKSGSDTTNGTPPSDWYAVSNIDKIPLALSTTTPYNLSETDKIAAKTGVTITLNIVDVVDKITGMSSGLAPTPIKWEGLTDWTTAKSITVHANGTYTVHLRDAVGNESSFQIPITNIVTNGPSVSLSGTDVDGHSIASETWWRGPVTLNAYASMGEAGARPDGMTYSWDGGQTWTTQSTYVCTKNGTYTVTIRDSSGTEATDTIYLGHLDNTAPVVGMYLYKGQPDDWNDRFPGKQCTEADYVWKMRIEVEDPGSALTEGNPSLGSGLYSIQYQWLGDRVVQMANVTNADRDACGGTITSSTTTYRHIFDVPRPGTYQVTVIDRAGNSIQVEKVAQWTDLGEDVEGPNPNVPITMPDTGGGPSGNDDTQHGTAGLPYDANIEDLIFGEDGVYNIVTGDFTPYPNGQKGIPINFQAEITRNRWGTGYVTYNNVKYTVTFSNPDSNGNNTTLGSFGSTANAKVLGTGNKIKCYAFIPLTAFHNDVKNARIYVTINEWDNEACTELLKTGSENLYTSVQKTHPTLTYTYNRVTDTMTVVATSSLSGIKKVEYKYDSGAWTDYVGPFVIGEPKPTTITLKATDNLGYETELVINVADLGLNGSSGGVGNLPQDTLTDDGSTSSYHSSNRAADIYIIGGTRGNTDQHPSGTVFDRLLG